jgi:hypothetical protein
MTEEWKDVVGFEGSYQVSNMGRVRSSRVLKPGSSGKGYKAISLWVNGKAKRVRVHKLVLEAFVGPCPPGMECCHGDSDRTNNALSNLRWDTKKNNAKDRDEAGGTAKGSKHGRSVIDENTAREVKRLLAMNESPAIIAKQLGIKRYIVMNIKQNHSWRHL